MQHRYITNQEEIDAIINKCEVCFVSMTDQEGKPYVIPLNFGYENGIVYLHSSQKGLKIDILRNNPAVCIAFSTDHQLRYQSEQVACSYSMKYRSVLVYGNVEFVEDMEAKQEMLKKVMAHYTGRSFSFSAPAVREVCVFCVKAERFSARVYGY